MTNAYVEYRPKSDDQTHGVTHHVVIVNDQEVGEIFRTQLSAEKWACAQGYTVPLPPQRHTQYLPTPAHYRVSDCRPYAGTDARVRNMQNAADAGIYILAERG